MRFRYTIAELQKKDSSDYLDDKKLILSLINERASDCYNPNAPLYKRLKQLQHNVENNSLANQPNENDSRLLVATDDEGNIIFSLLDNNNWNAALKTAIDENYDDREAEIISISEPDKMMERRVIIKVAEDGDDPYEITITLTPAYLYK